jgi:hypothetical protein
VADVIFGRHQDKEVPGNAVPSEAAVDVRLEWDIEAVQKAIEAFLQSQSDITRKALLAQLEKLDNQIDLSDTHASSIVGSPIFGRAPKGAVLGETGSHSMAEEVPSAVVQAQIALVRSAKTTIRDPSPTAFGELRAANDILAGMDRRSGPAET